MKLRVSKFARVSVLVVGLIASGPLIAPRAFSLYAQFGNSISGFVFGLKRQPLEDVDVELLDDLSRSIGRTRTSGSGRYIFNNLGSGRFKIRILPFRTDYQETEGEVEIINFSQSTSSGIRTGGHENAEKDFYLRLKRGVTAETTGSLFVQEIPPEAKKLYDQAIDEFAGKRNVDAYASLRAAIDIFPKYFAALERLGTEYIQMRRPEGFQAAEILFAAAVEVNPRAYRSWYGLAYARYSLQKYSEALPAAEKAIELNSGGTEAVMLSGVLLRLMKKYSEAEKQLVKARELSKGADAQVHWELALLYGNNMKRYADAAKELKLFLKAQPDTKDAESINKLIAEFEAKARKT